MGSDEVAPARTSLLMRALRRGRYEVANLLLLAYVYLIAIPICWSRGYTSFPLSVVRGYCSFLLLSNTKVVKFAISEKSTIAWEYANYMELTGRLPELSTILPEYTYSRGIFLSALVCERLIPVPAAEALLLATEARACLDKSIRAGTRLTLAQCTQIISGLQCVSQEFGGEMSAVLQALVCDFLATGTYSSGLAHGDFHSRNIMRDSAGHYKLIDLDCVRLEGIAEFDALYFALEQEWSASGAIWINTLEHCFATQGRSICASLDAFGVRWSAALGFAYFLDRVGQDFANYGIYYSRQQLAGVLDALPAAVGT